MFIEIQQQQLCLQLQELAASIGEHGAGTTPCTAHIHAGSKAVTDRYVGKNAVQHLGCRALPFVERIIRCTARIVLTICNLTRPIAVVECSQRITNGRLQRGLDAHSRHLLTITSSL